MNPAIAIEIKRGRFDGVRQIVRYNWPQYVGGIVIAASGIAWWSFSRQGPEWVRVVSLTTALLVVWWCIASLVASYWIYDLSPLYRWTWIPSALPAAPGRWLNLHAGLDESSSILCQLFPGSAARIGDFHDPAEMSEPSIQRARAKGMRSLPAECVDYRHLPYSDQSFDAVFLLFAAHELRRSVSRETFLREVHRVLAPSGTVLLVEHLRDWANFMAFGPGFFHFLPHSEWRRLAKITGLEVVNEQRMTPFVKSMLLRKES